ncbi:hypothetical protein RP20_CCG024668 [Aedes albopictus]|nr:hypothetical protein RP20_CCG024668 [Aedes albopictus]
MLWLRQAAKRKLERGLEQEIDRWNECHACGTGTKAHERKGFFKYRGAYKLIELSAGS